MPDALKKITARERAVLSLLGRGYTNAQIAIELGITVGTTKIHVSKVLSKLAVANRTQAAIVAQGSGSPDSNNDGGE